MEFIEHNGKKIAFTSKGKGKSLIFLHGFCENASMWDEFCEAFETDFQVTKIDFPGFGQSEAGESCSMESMADTVLAVIEHLKLKSSLLIGHSMGGYVSLELLNQRANLFDGLCLFHSHPFSDSESKKSDRKKAAAFIQKHGKALYLKQFFPFLFYPTFISSNRFLIEKITHEANNLDDQSIIDAINAMANRQSRVDVLRNLDIPVLQLIGREDKTISFEENIEQLAIPAVGSIHILDKVNHMGMYEAKTKCRRILKNFINFLSESN